MRNGLYTSIRLKRIDICDLMIACTLTKEMASDDGKKWDNLYEQLKSQLDKLDSQLDEL